VKDRKLDRFQAEAVEGLTCTPEKGTNDVCAIRAVILSQGAVKDLRKVPNFIRDKLLGWVGAVELRGLEEVRKVPGYHDEPLKGRRQGQRSIRLNRAYRAIYVVKNEAIQFVQVEEVTKHEY
jgi:proteic killer suppression protein